MTWDGDLRAQVLEEFRSAQALRGAIVQRDTKPENILVTEAPPASSEQAIARIADAILGNPPLVARNKPENIPARRRRIVGAAS